MLSTSRIKHLEKEKEEYDGRVRKKREKRTTQSGQSSWNSQNANGWGLYDYEQVYLGMVRKMS